MLKKMIITSLLILTCICINAESTNIKTGNIKTIKSSSTKKVYNPIEMTFNSIKKHKLTNTECISLISSKDEDANYDLINIYSNNKKCGGDPEVSSLLFSYRINKKTRKMETDAYEWAIKNKQQWEPGVFNSIN